MIPFQIQITTLCVSISLRNAFNDMSFDREISQWHGRKSVKKNAWIIEHTMRSGYVSLICVYSPKIYVILENVELFLRLKLCNDIYKNLHFLFFCFLIFNFLNITCSGYVFRICAYSPKIYIILENFELETSQ